MFLGLHKSLQGEGGVVIQQGKNGICKAIFEIFKAKKIYILALETRMDEHCNGKQYSIFKVFSYDTDTYYLPVDERMYYVLSHGRGSVLLFRKI